MVRDDAGEALGLAVDEHGLYHVDVGQVYAAGGVGVVQDEHVTLGHRVTVLVDDGRDGCGERAEVADDGEALCDDLPVAVAEGGGVVHRVLDDARVGGAHDREGHLVDQGVESVADHLEGDGVDVFGQHDGLLVDSVDLYDNVSGVVETSGAARGTTVVASYSSTMSGPCCGAPFSPPRPMTGVAMSP